MFPQSRNRLDTFVTAGLVVLAIGLSVAFYVALKPVDSAHGPGQNALPLQAGIEADASAAPQARDFTVIWEGEPDVQKPSASSTGRIVPANSSTAPDFQLVGVFRWTFSPSMACITRNGKQALYGLGDTVAEWEISDIRERSVTVTRDGEEKTLHMGQPAYARLPSRVSPETPLTRNTPVSNEPVSAPRAPGASGRGSLQTQRTRSTSQPRKPRPTKPEGVDATVAVAAGIIERLREDPASVKFGASFTPNLDKRGKMQGIVLNKIAAGSLAARYGLAPGDRILAVNGQAISSLNAAMELYQRYRGSDSVRVTIERGGLLRNVLFYAR